MECTIPGSSPVRSSTFSSSQTEIQTISNKKQSCRACCVDVQLLVPYQESLALPGPSIGVFLEDRDSGNAAPCTLLIVWMLC